MVASWRSLFINFAEAPRIRFGPSIKITPSWCRRGKRAQQTRPFWGKRPIWLVWPTWDAAFLGFGGVFPTFLSFKVKQIDVKCGTQAPLAQIGAGNTAQAPFWSSWWTLGNGKVNEIYQYPDAVVHGGWFSYNVVFQDDKNESQCLV